MVISGDKKKPNEFLSIFSKTMASQQTNPNHGINPLVHVIVEIYEK
jgi:hypothetical protein